MGSPRRRLRHEPPPRRAHRARSTTRCTHRRTTRCAAAFAASFAASSAACADRLRSQLRGAARRRQKARPLTGANARLRSAYRRDPQGAGRRRRAARGCSRRSGARTRRARGGGGDEGGPRATAGAAWAGRAAMEANHCATVSHDILLRRCGCRLRSTYRSARWPLSAHRRPLVAQARRCSLWRRQALNCVLNPWRAFWRRIHSGRASCWLQRNHA